MAKRIWGAGALAIAGVVCMLAPDVWARGGFGGHRGLAAAGPRPVGKTFVHGHAGLRRAGVLPHRFGRPLRGWWSTGWYGGYYDPDNYQLLHDRPGYAEPVYGAPVVGSPGYGAPGYGGPAYPLPAPRIVDVIVYRPGCSSETETVPWRDGKPHTITMVRC
jgi:hypothetical protein